MVLLVRHAWAGDRERFVGDDALRPLDARGRAQAAGLVALLAPFGVTRIVSSPAIRCRETVAPLAARLDLAVELRAELAEGGSAAAAVALVRGLADAAGCTVVCGHGGLDVAVLGQPPPRRWKKGSTLVLDGELRFVERLKSG